MAEELSDFGDFREGKSFGIKSGPDVQRAGGVGAVGVGVVAGGLSDLRDLIF